MSSPKIATYLILGICLLIFALQLQTLTTFPVADSVRWGGDETWLMREFGNQALHGAMQYPENFGDAPRTDGLLAGSMWFDALIYGATGQAFYTRADLVSVGRCVTSILSIVLLLSLYYILTRSGIDSRLSALLCLLLVTSRAFLLATHCARYDILTGLSLLWYIYLLSQHLGSIRTTRSILLGFASICILVFSRHLLTLSFPVTLIWLVYQQYHRSLRRLFDFAIGFILGSASLAIAYYAGAGEFSLFGRGGSFGSYGFVLAQIPIFRPFSRNVQTSNLAERIHLFSTDALGILVVVIVTLAGVIFLRIRKVRFGRREQYVLLSVGGATISWLLLQGSRPYYMMHVIPCLLFATAIIIKLLIEGVQVRRTSSLRAAFIATAGVLLIGTVVQVRASIPRGALGPQVRHDQEIAVHQLLSTIPQKGARVLCDVAALNFALKERKILALTLDMFQPPAQPAALLTKLQQNRIDYIILRSSAFSSPFEPGRAALPYTLDSIGSTRVSTIGYYYDDGRNYDSNIQQLRATPLDTLTLYSVRH